MLGLSGKGLARLVITRPLEKAGTVLLLAVMAAAASLLLLACPASPRCSVAVGSALSASKTLWVFGANNVAPAAEASASGDGDCDIFEGEWVWDDSYPLYGSMDCPFLDSGFRCSENGRPDASYTKWRWQPSCCDLPRGAYFQEGDEVKMDMTISDAYRRSIQTLFEWVRKEVNTSKTPGHLPYIFSGSLQRW